MRLSTIIKAFSSNYLKRYGQSSLPSHRHALGRLQGCRSKYSPHMKLKCTECEKQTYLPHSCGHRNCPHCQHHDSQAWIDQQLKRRVKDNYVMITFTVPAEFRPLFYSHQHKLYPLMFEVIWERLQASANMISNSKGRQGDSRPAYSESSTGLPPSYPHHYADGSDQQTARTVAGKKREGPLRKRSMTLTGHAHR